MRPSHLASLFCNLILGNVYFSTRTTLQTSSEFVHHSRELSFNKWTEEEQEEPDDDYPALKPSDAEMGELA
ncbi:hypothetical protein KXW98_005761 [Aspergillus fumigatus]|uniref:Uncharacterized protein n=1 Tax=Aspergillus fumigatus TaxID=746128 RepID=A0A229Y6I0_ASPFM|nr:hypothetical protein KXX45_008618 [Aspergillus fumigatus]KAH1283689.1 hypothetical protein KXX48_002181 [Aspergillus fumigatus]KAH1288917.1 hypothetical protein KXX30_007318 [Aspergillus fumigatus]KAH1305861.1 hypothetical protein KXX66_002568 [Aspergillus fumigatus]KAH1305932.1 hypothetical protein KXX11_008850 [Aspergillus fumigatus]